MLDAILLWTCTLFMFETVMLVTTLLMFLGQRIGSSAYNDENSNMFP